MKHHIRKMALPVVILALLVIIQTVSAAPLRPAPGAEAVSQVVYDNFDDNATNPARWTTGQAGGPTLSETNHRLEITLPANSSGDKFDASYYSACLLHGDFDMQVEYQLLNWPGANGVRVSLGTQYGNMERSSFATSGDLEGGPEVYLTDFAGTVKGITPTSDLSGKLRLVRVGSTLTGYYFDTAKGDWAAAASHATGSTDDASFGLAAWSHDPVFGDQEVKLAFDNLVINQGELLCQPVGVTLEQASGQADPTGSSPIRFTAVFSEPVTGFGDSASDLALSGTAGATTADVTGIAPNDGTTYSVAVSGMAASGTVIASIPAGAARSALKIANADSSSSDNTVTYHPVLPTTGQITPLSATCEQFAAGTAAGLNEVVYTVRNRHVRSVTPTDFYYYSQVTAPAASFQIKVAQSNPNRWPNLTSPRLDSSTYTVYKADCTPINTYRTVSKTTVTFYVAPAAPGAVYYVRVRYQASSVLGKVVTNPFPAVPYTFTTARNNTLLDTSIVNITFRPQ